MLNLDIVWFKRDLRTLDNISLEIAANSSNPVLFIYLFEPSLMNYPDYDSRHLGFIYESLLDIEKKFKSYSLKLNLLKCEAQEFFEEISKMYNVNQVLSYQEIGNNLTFERDMYLLDFFKKNNIKWLQHKTNGVIRGLKSRKDWKKKWVDEMNSKISLSDLNLIDKTEVDIPKKIKSYSLNINNNKNFQPGGETYAWMYMNSFLKKRHKGYTKNISSPINSRTSCSRLSPYITYGNLSSKQVYQFFCESKNRDIRNFLSRLQWRCHFMQKFDDEPSMEFDNINSAYNSIRDEYNEDLISKWKEGKTGIPIIDACMRCLDKTGYLNFRMRAMIVSFAAFNLWQNWKNLVTF